MNNNHLYFFGWLVIFLLNILISESKLNLASTILRITIMFRWEVLCSHVYSLNMPMVLNLIPISIFLYKTIFDPRSTGSELDTQWSAYIRHINNNTLQLHYYDTVSGRGIRIIITTQSSHAFCIQISIE